MMRRADRSDWDMVSDEIWEATSSSQPDWGNTPVVPAQPAHPVYQPHAPMEVPPDSPTTPPMPENLPIGDPKHTRSEMAPRWPSQGVYF
jgi:hypothetical protein